MTLVIDRTIWLRGEGSWYSQLLRQTDNKQCCVGILLEQLGVPREQLVGLPSAHTTPSRYPERVVKEFLSVAEAAGLVRLVGGMAYRTDWALSLYNLNDDTGITEKARERDLAAAFAEGGIEVTFTDGEETHD